jgi:hypothetical protein
MAARAGDALRLRPTAFGSAHPRRESYTTSWDTTPRPRTPRRLYDAAESSEAVTVFHLPLTVGATTTPTPTR